MLQGIANVHVLYVCGELRQSSGWREPQLHHRVGQRIPMPRGDSQTAQLA